MVIASDVTTLLIALGLEINQSLLFFLTLTIPIVQQMMVRVEPVTRLRSK